MIRLRTASALAIGAVAALALGGTALAAGNDDPSAPPAVEMLPDGTVVTPSPSMSSDDSVSPSPSASSDDSASPSPSASTSASTSGDDSASASPSPSTSASSARAISLGEAKAIAVKAAGGGRVTDAERETEHGRAVWDIEVQRGGVEHDIHVDRTTGDVLRHRSEADDDHGRGHDDDHGRGHDDDGSDD